MNPITTCGSACQFESIGGQPIDFNRDGLRIDQPVFAHPVPREQLHLAPAVVAGGARRQNLDREIGRVARDHARVQQMLAVAREQQQIRLDDVEVGQYDVERRVEHNSAIRPRVLFEHKMETRGDDLMQQQR